MSTSFQEVAGRQEVEQTLALARDATERNIALYRLLAFACIVPVTVLVHVVANEQTWSPTMVFVGALAYAAVMRVAVARVGARAVLVLASLIVDLSVSVLNFFVAARYHPSGEHALFAISVTAPGLMLVVAINSLRYSRTASIACAVGAPVIYALVVLRFAGFQPSELPVVVIVTVSGFISYAAAGNARRNLDLFARFQLLRRYLPVAAVERVLREDPDVATAVGGRLRTVTMLASDLRGFTAMSEQLEPGEVLKQLNAYHAAMMNVIEDHGGAIDKFIGDGTLVVFGLEAKPEEGARAAVACAAAMLEALAVHNVERATRAEAPLRMGIGIHTGPVVAGNIGVPGRRLEFTVIGDAVNTAARLEGETKQVGTSVLVSEDSAALLEGAGLRELAAISIRGKERPVRVYALASANDP